MGVRLDEEGGREGREEGRASCSKGEEQGYCDLENKEEVSVICKKGKRSLLVLETRNVKASVGRSRQSLLCARVWVSYALAGRWKLYPTHL